MMARKGNVEYSKIQASVSTLLVELSCISTNGVARTSKVNWLGKNIIENLLVSAENTDVTPMLKV